MQKKNYKLFNLASLGLLLLFLVSACGSPFKKGLAKYQLAEYNEAITHFEEALKSSNASKAKINSYIAESYRSSGRVKQAEPYYKAALDANSSEDKIRFYYAYSLKATGKYKEAVERFKTYSKTGGDTKLRKRALDEVKNIDKIKEILDTETHFEIKNCEAINTDAAEFGPVIHEDKLFFSTERKDALYKGTGTGFLSIYEHNLEGVKNGTGNSDVFDPSLMQENAHDASPAFSHNGKFMIFARSGTGEKVREDDAVNEVDLYVTRQTESGWSLPEKLDISNSKYWDACPFIHPNGKRLYFVSNRSGGYGGLDIWVASLDGSGRAFGVRNLGPSINTPGDEMFPFVSNGGVLYFASDGHPGLGQLDLFEAIRQDGKTRIKNLGKPINSSEDDFAMYFETDTTGYYSSNRKGGKGNDDIYSFLDNRPEVRKVNYFLTINVIGVDSAKREYPLSDAGVQVSLGDKEDRGDLVHDFKTDANGKIKAFPISVDNPTDYLLEASKGYTYTKEFLNYTTGGRQIAYELRPAGISDTTYEVTMKLYEIFINEKWEIEINFDFDSAAIRTDAAFVLDSVAQFLLDNPYLEIELGSHTDAVGTADKNMRLSQSRANSTLEYLVTKGVPRDRMEARGYGKTQLKINTQEANEENRRTEIKITGIRKPEGDD